MWQSFDQVICLCISSCAFEGLHVNFRSGGCHSYDIGYGYRRCLCNDGCCSHGACALEISRAKGTGGSGNSSVVELDGEAEISRPTMKAYGSRKSRRTLSALHTARRPSA